MKENNKSLEELLNKLPPSIKYKNDFGEIRISKFYDASLKWSVEYFFSSTSNVAPISYWDETLSIACKKMLAFLEENNLLKYWFEGAINMEKKMSIEEGIKTELDEMEGKTKDKDVIKSINHIRKTLLE